VQCATHEVTQIEIGCFLVARNVATIGNFLGEVLALKLFNH